MEFENMITLTIIYAWPEETCTIHLLWWILAINIFSANVRFFSTVRNGPIQKELDKDWGGFMPFCKNDWHDWQTCLQFSANIGPFNGSIRSELFRCSYVSILPGEIIYKSHCKSFNKTILFKDDTCPYTAHPASVRLSGLVSLQSPLIIVSIRAVEGGFGGNLAIDFKGMGLVFCFFLVLILILNFFFFSQSTET